MFDTVSGEQCDLIVKSNSSEGSPNRYWLCRCKSLDASCWDIMSPKWHTMNVNVLWLCIMNACLRKAFSLCMLKCPQLMNWPFYCVVFHHISSSRSFGGHSKEAYDNHLWSFIDWSFYRYKLCTESAFFFFLIPPEKTVRDYKDEKRDDRTTWLSAHLFFIFYFKHAWWSLSPARWLLVRSGVHPGLVSNP